MANKDKSHNNSDYEAKSGKSKKFGRNGRRWNGDMAHNVTPTLASLVGAGVAVGIGLYATRRSWMPIAEDWNKQIQERWDAYMHSENAHEETPMSDYSEQQGKGAANAKTSGSENPMPGL